MPQKKHNKLSVIKYRKIVLDRGATRLEHYVDKENLNFQLREEIRFYAKFIVAHKRQMLYKKTLMNIPELKILPESIIHMIAHLTYDHKSYLKL